MSISRACRTAGLTRSNFHYKPHPRDDSDLENKMLELASEHRRFGHSRLHVLLRRSGFKNNHKRTYRVYTKPGLRIKRRKRKKLRASRSQLANNPYGSKSVLAIDFVFDYLETGRRLKVLTTIDEHYKHSPAILIDQGTEFTSRAFLDWAYKNNMELDSTRVRKPNHHLYLWLYCQ